MSGFSGQLGGAVHASAALAENIAAASRNASVAASATGIGAIVAVIGTVLALTIGWNKETKEIADNIGQVRLQTDRLNAQAAGDKRLENELQIKEAMEGELKAADQLDHWYRKLFGHWDKFPQLQDAIRSKAAAARRAFAAEVGRNYADEGDEIERSINPFIGGTDRQRQRFIRERELQMQFDENLKQLRRNSKGYNPDQQYDLAQLYEEQFKSGMRDLERDLDAPARELGDSLGRSISNAISDGIQNAIKNRSLTDGFKALTGDILIGFGSMIEEIGTQSLLAAQLFQSLIAAFQAFAPEGAIASSLELIAFGAILKGVGASMQGGGGSSRSVAGGGRTSAFIGSVISTSPSTTAGGAAALSPGGANFFSFNVIGTKDPTAQREIVSLVRAGLKREGKDL